MEPLLDRVVFSVAGSDHRWSDAVLAAALRGTWDGVERDARHGLAAATEVEARLEQPKQSEVTAAAHRFRYDRNLLSADETLDWLRRFGLDEASWLAYLRREVLRERLAPELDAVEKRRPVSPEQLEQIVLAEAICSGELVRSAEWLAGVVAVAWGVPPSGTGLEPLPPVPRVPGLDPEAGTLRLAELADRAATAERVLEARAAEADLDREILARRIDWISIDLERAVVGSLDAAREVALLIQEDGSPLADASAAAGSPALRERVLLEDLEPDLRDLCLGATPGAVLGPVATEDGWVVAIAGARSEPDPGDPVVRARALEAIRSRTVDRESNAKVRWHERI